MSTVVTTLMPLVSTQAYKKVVMCEGLHNLGTYRGHPGEGPGNTLPCLHPVRCDASESSAPARTLLQQIRDMRSFVITSSLAPPSRRLRVCVSLVVSHFFPIAAMTAEKSSSSLPMRLAVLYISFAAAATGISCASSSPSANASRACPSAGA